MPIFGLAAAAPSDRDGVAEVLLDTLLSGFVLATTKTTVLQDWMKGRRSEVDDLFGLVVREHAANSMVAPVNTAVAELAHRSEHRELNPGTSNLRLLRSLAGLDKEIV